MTIHFDRTTKDHDSFDQSPDTDAEYDQCTDTDAGKQDTYDRAYELDNSFGRIAKIKVMYTERTEKDAEQPGCQF